jgi:hypothetical protein
MSGAAHGMKIISRAEARANKAKASARGDRHYVGRPCVSGHVEKYVSNGKCIECQATRRSTPERKAYMRAYHARPEAKAAQRTRESTPEAKAAKRERGRKERGLPPSTRPCPELCEMPGCIRKATCLDHCHRTGAFRGWLCRRHNSALGLLGDDLMDFDEHAKQMRNYLLRYSQFNYLYEEAA